MKSLLFVSEIGGFQGGVESFIHRAADVLSRNGVVCRGVFAREGLDRERFAAPFAEVAWDGRVPEAWARGADGVWAHKSADLSALLPLRSLTKVAVYVHDHDYYCFRRHKYLPFGRINCPSPARSWCRLCGMLSRGAGDWTAFRRNLAALRRMDKVVAGSDFMLDNLAQNGVAREKLVKLPPLVEMNAGGEHAPQAGSLLFVGQVIRGKGLDLLLRALTMVESPWRLTVLGQGNDKERCREMAGRYGIADRVEFVGFVPDVGPYYRRSAVLVFPSRWSEPYGMTGPEALACGVPVAGFAVGGAGEWLHDGENGLAARPRDAADLAGKLDRLLRNPELARALGAAGRAWTAQFTGERFAARVEEIFSA